MLICIVYEIIIRNKKCSYSQLFWIYFMTKVDCCYFPMYIELYYGISHMLYGNCPVWKMRTLNRIRKLSCSTIKTQLQILKIEQWKKFTRIRNYYVIKWKFQTTKKIPKKKKFIICTYFSLYDVKWARKLLKWNPSIRYIFGYLDGFNSFMSESCLQHFNSMSWVSGDKFVFGISGEMKG